MVKGLEYSAAQHNIFTAGISRSTCHSRDQLLQMKIEPYLDKLYGDLLSLLLLADPDEVMVKRYFNDSNVVVAHVGQHKVGWLFYQKSVANTN
jgi:hypothetical protein